MFWNWWLSKFFLESEKISHCLYRRVNSNILEKKSEKLLEATVWCTTILECYLSFQIESLKELHLGIILCILLYLLFTVFVLSSNKVHLHTYSDVKTM